MNLTDVFCPICGVHFAIPANQYDYLKEKGGSFWCPNGHSLNFGDPTTDKLKREILALQRRLAEAHEEITRQKNVVIYKNEKFLQLGKRINAGVCPHCHRTFRALARHVQTVHPGEPLPNSL